MSAAIIELRAQEQKMVSFVVKNTFIDLDDDTNCGIDMTRRQMSEPVRSLKTIDFEPLKAFREEIPVDPAGPEPEPEAEARAEVKKPRADEDHMPVTKWDRLTTGERWANLDEADQEPEVTAEASAPQQEAPFSHFGPAAPFFPMPYGGMPYDYDGSYFMAPYAQYDEAGYSLADGSDGSGMHQVPMPSFCDDGEGLLVEPRRRRRRAGNSLIDIAKKRLQAHPVVTHGAALAPGAQPSSTEDESKVCATCDRKFAAMFRFCHICGIELQTST